MCLPFCLYITDWNFNKPLAFTGLLIDKSVLMCHDAILMLCGVLSV